MTAGVVILWSGGAAQAGSLEGSSCQNPYRYVRDLRAWYHPPQLGATTTNQVGPYANVRSHNIRGSLTIGYDAFSESGLLVSPAHPLPITGVELDVQWWLAEAGHGKLCETKITFDGLPTFVAHTHGSIGGKRFSFHHVHTDRPLALEITSAR
jgi:hypothetical protein